MIKYLAIASILLSCLLQGCIDRNKQGQPLDTTTSGYIKIAVDESLRPLIDAEIEVFEGIYRRADIEPVYLPEADAVDALLKDSVRLAVVTRRLLPEEKEYFRQIKITPEEVDVATSAIALVVNRQNPDTTISLNEIIALLQGKISTWNALGQGSSAGIKIVFDNPNSGLIRYLKDSVARVDKLPDNCYAVKDNPGVIDFVANNPDALGLIGVEWISDRDDSVSKAFLQKVRVMAVSNDSAYFQPFQAHVAQGYYPLPRKITILSREARKGLGSGFIAFFASQPGQRIVLKAGLVPENMPMRVIEVYQKPFAIEK